jgi:DNA-binding transcriptional ArsR family regulator
MEETKEYHERYLRAVNNPLRRDILRALKDGDATLKTLESITGLDTKTLDWHMSILEHGFHMSILEHGFCVEREEESGKTLYRLTQEGKVVDYVDKE